ncbi:MAG: anthranilate synthase component I [Blastochloris sp.]|nr:anthranilate synthase component I [Blastochloris sp.]
MVFPSKDIFCELARQGNLIPVYREIIADLETPMSAYLKLDTGRHTFLLESAEKGQRFSRYSFVGADPSTIFSTSNGHVRIEENGQVREYESHTDPLEELRLLMARYRPITFGELPIFYGGAVGYLTYESVRYFEPKVPMAKKDDLNLPDAYFIVSDSLLIFDHSTRRIKILVNAHVLDDPGATFDLAVKKIDELENRLRRPISHSVLEVNRELEPCVSQPNMTKDEYVQMTSRMQEYIHAGDIFQVVPSQRFSVPFDRDPIDLYRSLRYINPSPYMFCLKLGDVALVGSSPETHVRCENGRVEIHPIAGTRPRRALPDEDEAMEKELLADPKERAEHVMLVDLARNDVGRVCRFDSVRVTDFMKIERYSHVMHIVSHVEGQLDPQYSVYDVMRATFPAGTVSGSPKVRAMQIIAELEPTRRGTYSGAVGYFGFSGNLDSCIAIRTVLIKDGLAHVQAGGGLVADSTPLGEYEESVNKAKASLKAIALAKSFK